MNLWNIFRKAGAGLILLSMVLMWQGLYWESLSVLLIAMGLDITLAVKKEDTISNWVHSLFPQRIDYVFMVAFAAFSWYIWGLEGFLPFMMGVIVGHLFWHEE